MNDAVQLAAAAKEWAKDTNTLLTLQAFRIFKRLHCTDIQRELIASTGDERFYRKYVVGGKE